VRGDPQRPQREVLDRVELQERDHAEPIM
jgi:hypothetical protein